jgi:adenine-specific DNA methylase
VNKHGSEAWKKETGYHWRSLNEVVMFRYRKIFIGELEVGTSKNQETEVMLKCLTLNKFIGTGMLNAYKIS